MTMRRLSPQDCYCLAAQLQALFIELRKGRAPVTSAMLYFGPLS